MKPLEDWRWGKEELETVEDRGRIAGEALSRQVIRYRLIVIARSCQVSAGSQR